MLRQFPLLRTRGYMIHPPYGDLALQLGDTYQFTHGGRNVYCIFDGAEWRLVHERLTGSPNDFDPDVVSLI